MYVVLVSRRKIKNSIHTQLYTKFKFYARQLSLRMALYVDLTILLTIWFLCYEKNDRGCTETGDTHEIHMNSFDFAEINRLWFPFDCQTMVEWLYGFKVNWCPNTLPHHWIELTNLNWTDLRNFYFLMLPRQQDKDRKRECERERIVFVDANGVFLMFLSTSIAVGRGTICAFG